MGLYGRYNQIKKEQKIDFTPIFDRQFSNKANAADARTSRSGFAALYALNRYRGKRMAIISCNLDLTCQLVEGRINLDEIIETLIKFYESDPTKNVLWDYRDAVLDNFSVDDIHIIVDRIEPYAESRTGGKTAVVAPNDLAFGLSRAFEMIGDRLPFEIEVFRTLSDAIKWLSKNTID